MKLIHCADLHLDAKMTSFLTPEQAKERRTELLHTFLRMLEYAEEAKAQAVLLAGDLFDRPQISVTAWRVVQDAIQKHSGMDFFYVTGNHESDGFLSRLTEIPSNLKLFGSTWRTYEAGTVCITGANLEKDNKQKLWDTLLLPPEKYNIVMLHGQIAEYAADRRAEIIDLSSMRNKNIDYLALGHLHAYREEPLPPRGVWCYPGCLEGRGFDECGAHGFVLLEIDPQTRQSKRTFVPFAKRQYREAETDISGCRTTTEIITRIEERWGADLPKESPSPDIWRFVLTGEVDVSCEIAPDWITQLFSSRCYACQVKNKTQLKFDVQQFALDASLKGEFVRLVEGRTDWSAQEKAEVIRCGLQALAKEEWER